MKDFFPRHRCGYHGGFLQPLFNHRMEWGRLFLDKPNAAMLDSSGPVLGMDTSRSRTGGIRGWAVHQGELGGRVSYRTWSQIIIRSGPAWPCPILQALPNTSCSQLLNRHWTWCHCLWWERKQICCESVGHPRRRWNLWVPSPLKSSCIDVTVGDGGQSLIIWWCKQTLLEQTAWWLGVSNCCMRIPE